MRKTILFLAVAIFLMSSVCFGAKIDPTKIVVPRDSGRIVETYVSPNANAPLIAYVQDIHANYESQKAEANIVETLFRDYGFELMLMEGQQAGLTDDFKYLRKKATQEARNITADRLLRKGTFSCSGYLDLATNYNFITDGVEDLAIYKKEATDLASIYGMKDEALRLVSTLQNITSNLKLHIYTKEMRDLDDKTVAYDKDEIGLVEYVKFLDTASKANNVDIKALPNLSLFIESANLEGQINFPAVETERQAVNTAIEKVLTGKAKDDFAAANLKFRTGDMTQAQFYTYLKDAAEIAKVNLTPHKNLSLYTKYITTYEKIDTTNLFKEIDQLTDKIKTAMIKTPEQKQLSQIDKDLSILSDMISTKLVPDEYNYFQQNKTAFDPDGWLKFIRENSVKFNLTNPVPDNVSILKANMPVLEKFYAVSFERDTAFITNIKAALAKHKKDKAILVIGGFHTPNMKKLFKENGFSYLVVAPRIDVVKDYSDIYKAKAKDDLEYLQKMFQPAAAAAGNMNNLTEAQKKLQLGQKPDAELDAVVAELGKAGQTLAGSPTPGLTTWDECRLRLKQARATGNPKDISEAVEDVKKALQGKGLVDAEGNLVGLASEAHSTLVYKDGPKQGERVLVPPGIILQEGLSPEQEAFVLAHEVAHKVVTGMSLRAAVKGQEEAIADAIARKLRGEAPQVNDAELLASFVAAAKAMANAQANLLPDGKVNPMVQNLIDAVSRIQPSAADLAKGVTPITVEGLRDALSVIGISTQIIRMNLTNLRLETQEEEITNTATAHGLTAVTTTFMDSLTTAIDANNTGLVTSTLATSDSVTMAQVVSMVSYDQLASLRGMADITPVLQPVVQPIVNQKFETLNAYFTQVEKFLGRKLTPEEKAAATADLQADGFNTEAALLAMKAGNTKPAGLKGEVQGVEILVDATLESDGTDELLKSAKAAMGVTTDLNVKVTPFTTETSMQERKARALANGRIPIVLTKKATKQQMAGAVTLQVGTLKSQNGVDAAQAIIRHALKIEGLKAITNKDEQTKAASRIGVGLSALTLQRAGQVTAEMVLALVPGLKDDDERFNIVKLLVLLPAARPEDIQLFMQQLVFVSFA